MDKDDVFRGVGAGCVRNMKMEDRQGGGESGVAVAAKQCSNFLSPTLISATHHTPAAFCISVPTHLSRVLAASMLVKGQHTEL